MDLLNFGGFSGLIINSTLNAGNNNSLTNIEENGSDAVEFYHGQLWWCNVVRGFWKGLFEYR
jgi:hypothetical protein